MLPVSGPKLASEHIAKTTGTYLDSHALGTFVKLIHSPNNQAAVALIHCVVPANCRLSVDLTATDV